MSDQQPVSNQPTTVSRWDPRRQFLSAHTGMTKAEVEEYVKLEQEAEYAVRRMFQLVNPKIEEVKEVRDYLYDDWRGAIDTLADPEALVGQYYLTDEVMFSREMEAYEMEAEEAEEAEDAE